MSVTLKPWGVYNMTKTLQELLAERSLGSQARIQQLAEQLFLENQLYRIREDA